MFAHRRSFLASLVAAALLLGGCSDSSTPGEDVPAIASALHQVEVAIAAGQFDRARVRLNALVETTRTAHDAGELGGSEAESILSAAAELLSALPQNQGALKEDDTPTVSDVPAEVPSEDGVSKKDAKQPKKSHGKQKKHGKGQKR